MEYDPFDPAIIADPYPHYAQLREQSACQYVRKRDIYVLSRYDDVRSALNNNADYSSDQGVGYERRPVPMLIACDPPEHSRLRRIVAGRFTPRALAQWTPRIEAILQSLLDPLIGAGPVELVEALAGPFPVQVIAEMMDIPIERRADFKRWSDETIVALSGAVGLARKRREAVDSALVEFANYFYQVIQERAARAHESEDLISLLIRPNEEGERLTDAEVISFCVLLLVAGNETTTNLIGNLFHHLASHAADWAALKRDPARARGAIEESLRHEAPIQGFFRNTTQLIETAGGSIPRNAKVMLLYAAANRDPRKYEAPDEFRLERNPIDHIAFGFGPHTCLGAHLARLEARALLERALRQIDEVELTGKPVRTQNPLLRGFQHLPVQLHAV